MLSNTDELPRLAMRLLGGAQNGHGMAVLWLGYECLHNANSLPAELISFRFIFSNDGEVL